MRANFSRWTLVLSLWMASFGVASCRKATGEGEHGGKGGKGDGKGARKDTTIVVRVAAVRTESLPSLVQFPVFLEGRKQVNVYPRIGGRVQSLRKSTGDKVQRGEPLFLVDRSEPGENFLALPVTSPITGFVALWSIMEGDQVSPGEQAVLVVDDSALRAKLWLPVADWQLVDDKARVKLAVNAVEKKAEIVSIARAVEVSAGKGLVEVEVDNSKGEWKAGFSALATVELVPQPRLVVPAEALLLTNDGAFVYVLSGDVVKRQKVSFKPRTPDTVELPVGSLADETQLVISGTSRLSDNAKVKVGGASPL